MKVKYKLRLTYFTIGVFFLLGGIEYAVILPTLWLYLETYFQSQSYMLGIVLSSFSMASLLFSPLFGTWSDKTSNTKVVILFANIFSFVGSCMYSLGISDWFLVLSRFVAGIGSAVGAAIFGDIARTTSVEERTSVMSIFMAVRQFGLLAGPGFNLFLRQLDFTIGPFHIDKYTAPGVFMGLLWAIHEVLMIFIYWNLPYLQNELKNELLKENLNYEKRNTSSESSNLNVDNSGFDDLRTYSPIPSLTEREDNEEIDPNLDNGENREASERPHCLFEIGSAPINLQEKQLALSTSTEAIVSAENYMSTSPNYLQYTEAYAHNDTVKISKAFQVNQEGAAFNNGHSENQPNELNDNTNQDNYPSINSHSDNNLNAQSENATAAFFPSSALNPDLSDDQGQQNNTAHDQIVTSTPGAKMFKTNLSTNNNTPHATVSNGPITEEMRSIYNEGDSGSRSESPCLKSPEVKITWRYLVEEFVREEVVVVLATVFTAFFGQLVLETACTPLTKKLLDWGEIENSLLYCGAGLEILCVFIFISWLSKKIHDRWLLLLGYVFLVITLSFITYFLPTAKPEFYTKNFTFLILGISMDIFSIPFLAVVGTSLYSKITRTETQGLAHGLRRTTTGLATILGPLWAGSLIEHLFIMFGVCLGLSVLVMVMLVLSFNRLKENRPYANHLSNDTASERHTEDLDTVDSQPLITDT